MERAQNVHLLGVCGVGMAGLAYLLSRRGCRVSGCDLHPNEWATWLEASGIPVYAGHSPAHLSEETTHLVVSTAVPWSSPEIRAAQEKGDPVSRRGEVLARYLRDFFTVAVCGTHGKTTTSCFTARLFQELGLSPGWCIGGRTEQLGAVAGEGAGQLMVVEADESDGTLAAYHPDILVVTNIDLDHLEHFTGEDELVGCFQRAIEQTRVGVAVCADHPRAMRAVSGAKRPVLTFGFSEQAMLRAAAVETTATGVSFEMWYRGICQGRMTLEVAGAHNILNALAAAAAAWMKGCSPDAILRALPRACRQLPERRFERICEVSGATFIADYAHHPVELAAAVGMARNLNPKRLIVVFQPHRYTRTRALGADFPHAFDAADEVVLLPVYAASEQPLPGGESTDLYAHFRSQRPEKRILLARSLEEVANYLQTYLEPGDLVLIAGAGDVIGLADRARQGALDRVKADGASLAFAAQGGVHVDVDGTLSEWSSYGVGGRARFRVEVDDEQSLASVLKECAARKIPIRFFGAGANMWVSDLGEQGCAIRWSGTACRAFERLPTGELVVGCGWRGPVLLERLTQVGLAGLEFLEGVPGSLGGWLAMNAGAHGGEIASRVKWIRCLNREGESVILSPNDLKFSYRRCAGLERRIAVQCALDLTDDTPERIKMRRQAIREKRIPLAGLRTAGSVFRNPAGDSAGRLLDVAGLKGQRIGGAVVADIHANIVVAERGATASDILALVQRMRRQVMQTCQVALHPEVCGLE